MEGWLLAGVLVWGVSVLWAYMHGRADAAQDIADGKLPLPPPRRRGE